MSEGEVVPIRDKDDTNIEYYQDTIKTIDAKDSMKTFYTI